jgi:hypothetical protein
VCCAKRRTGGKSAFMPNYQIEDMFIKDFSNFLSSTQIKDWLTLYLAEKLSTCAVTRLGIMSNQREAPTADLRNSQEEADTFLILYSAEIHKSGTNVHIYA